MKPVLVTSYVNPDIDGIACSFAYAELLNAQDSRAVAGYFGDTHVEARYVLDRFRIPYPQQLQNTDDSEKVIIVDVSNPGDLEGKIPLDKVVEIIDHRKVHEAEKFPNAKVQIELVGSAATLIAEKFKATNIIPSKSSAILMVSAIISNTFNFQAKVATDRDKAMFDWLSPIAKLPDHYTRELFLAKSDVSGERLGNVLRDDLAIFDFGTYHVGLAQIEMIGGFELIQDRKEEIFAILADLKKKESLDWVYLSIVELEKVCNIFVAVDEIPRKVISELFKVEFSDNIAVKEGLVMRKEAVALLKEYFQNKNV